MIRPATSEDVFLLVSLEVACFGTGAWGAASLESAIADPAQHVLLTATGDSYGVVRLVDDTADLDRIAVLPAMRRHGSARALLRELTERAIRSGATRMMLEVAADNDGALGLYRSVGFEQIHVRRGYYRGGVDAVIMQRQLADGHRRARLGP